MKVAIGFSGVDVTDRISAVATASPKVNPVATTPAVTAPSTLDAMLNKSRSDGEEKRMGESDQERKEEKKEKSH